MRYRYEDDTPEIADDAFIADSADLVGRVRVDADASIWFNTVLRGDNDLIHIGRGSNIQDGCVVHTDPGIRVIVEENVTVGHRVVLHGCRVGPDSLVGINSVILNGASIGRWCLVGANTLITSGKTIPDRSLVLGSPGKVIREVTDEECDLIRQSARSYREKTLRYRDRLTRLG
ncbi:MAG: gamma carbonic anhydrase family protein [Proteobacteria bacterium]|nr:MAG: gamma carbonic anhydrase family protein [Pseudomonadota bacterium]